MTFLCVIALRTKTVAHNSFLPLGQHKWPSLSGKIIQVQKFCYHGNVMSHFPSLLGHLENGRGGKRPQHGPSIGRSNTLKSVRLKLVFTQSFVMSFPRVQKKIQCLENIFRVEDAHEGRLEGGLFFFPLSLSYYPLRRDVVIVSHEIPQPSPDFKG